jgi:hypothetical protein
MEAMNSSIFTSLARRYLVPAALAGATFAGTLGFAGAASADERVVVAAKPGVAVIAPTPGIQLVAKGPSFEILEKRPEVVVAPAPVVAPAAPPAVEVVKERPEVIVEKRPEVIVERRPEVIIQRRPVVEVVAPAYGYGPAFYGVYGRPGWGRGGAVLGGREGFRGGRR